MGSAQVKQSTSTLYDRLGGIYSIAAVVDAFSNAIYADPLVGINSPNPQLREWHRNQRDRLPGLKWMRTLWVADATGGPFKYHASVPSRVGTCPFANQSVVSVPTTISTDTNDATLVGTMATGVDGITTPTNPFVFSGNTSKCPLSLNNAHIQLQITAKEFDAVANILSQTLDSFGVAGNDKSDLLSAFASHKPDVTQGSSL